MDKNLEANNYQAFRDAWTSGRSPSIAEFLPPPSSPSRLPSLIELVVLDVQMRVEADKIRLSAREQPMDLVSDLVDQYACAFDELQPEKQYNDLSSRLHVLLSDLLFETQFESQGDTAANRCESAATQSWPTGDRYTPLAEYARGGMGVIWRVTDHQLGREVAQKRLPANLATNAAIRTRFVTEARVTARLEHPGVVPIYDLVEIDDGEPSYTMKLMRGETMAVAIKRFHSLKANDPSRAVFQRRLIDAFLSVCRTIAFAHRNKVLHRDIKPDNILLGEFGETAVLDWGLAKVHDSNALSEAVANSDIGVTLSDGEGSAHNATRQGTLLGTPAYMSPEQARGETASETSDCYGLGAVLYHILTGRPPLEANSLDELLKAVSDIAPTSPKEVQRNVPPPLDAICLKLLAKKRSERYQSAAEIVVDLERYAADEPVSCARESLVERAFRWMRKHKTQVVVGVSAILFTAVSTTAFVLVAQANQTREFAEVQRIAQAQSAAETAVAVADEQIRNDDFSGATSVLTGAIEQITDIDELSEFKSELIAKHARISKLASYGQHYDALYHLAFTSEIDRAYRTAKQCLVALGIDDPNVVWHEALPTQDLSDSQKLRTKEQIHGIFLHLAAAQASSGFTEFVRMNASANVFTVESNRQIKSKIDQASLYLDRADDYRKTTAARYFRLVVKLGTGEMPLLQWMAEWVALAPQEPVSAVDCHYTATIYGMSEQLKPHMEAFLKTAEFLGSETRMRDAHQETLRLLQKAVRLEPDYYPSLFLRGQLLAKEGNHQSALEAFNACLKIAPNAPEAYTGRAMAVLVQSILLGDEAWKQELQEQVHADVRRALNLAPHNGQIRQEVGTLQCYAGQTEDGMQNLLLGLDLSSTRVASPGISQMLDPQAFLNQIELVSDLTGVEAQTRVFKATTYADYGRHRKAWDLLRDLPPDSPLAYQIYALKAICACNLVTGENWKALDSSLDSDQVLSWTQEASSADEHYYRGWYARALVLRKIGRNQEALETIQKVLTEKDEYRDWQVFEMLWYKGEVLGDMQRAEEAETAKRAARELSEIYYEHFADRTGLE